jgi:hypothetical protein
MANQKWPYPQSKEQLLHVTMIFVTCLLIGVIGTAMQADHYKHKVLNHDNIEEAATSLQSYASEAALLTDQTLHKRTPQNYQDTYTEQLDSQTTEIITFLESHAIPEYLRSQTSRLLVEAHLFTQQLTSMGDSTDHNSLIEAHQSFTTSRDTFGTIEESL